MILLLDGSYTLASALFDKIEQIKAEERDPNVRTYIHLALAKRALAEGDPGMYLTQTAAAAYCCEQVGDIRKMCTIQGNLGFAQSEIGAYEPAERALRESLATAERLGLSSLTTNTKHNLGLVLARLGVLDEALRVETEAVEGASSQGDHRLISFSRSCVAMILHLQGALHEAEREAAAAVSARSIAPPVRAYALATLASVRLSMGKTIEALHDATEARGIFDALGGIEVGEALIRLVHAEALHANGDRGAALEAITAASARLLARAAKLDGALREGFLTRVPENARTLVLARSWTEAPTS
jgi:tetratricopeptide (TPR) repeat protein